jgi:hypothetical protein
MKFCEVCGLTHFDDQPLCGPEEYKYGKIITEPDGSLSYEKAGGVSECRSANANDAEDAGIMPMSRAVPIVAYHAKCTREQAKSALVKTYDGEWHHTGMLSRRTRYYSVPAAVSFLRQGKVN